MKNLAILEQKVFKKLKKANIFFDDLKEAYKFVNKIWNNRVETWWNSSEVQKAVRYFNLNFSKKRTNVLSDLKKFWKINENNRYTRWSRLFCSFNG